MATINTIEDLIQLLDDNSHWVEALRARLLTRELIELPEKLAKFVDPTSQRFDRIEGLLDRLIDDVAMLKGAVTREVALQQADVIAEDMGLTLVRVLSRDDLRPLIRWQPAADIPACHLRSFLLADLLVEAADPDGETVYIAVEVSFTVKERGRHKGRAQCRFPVPLHRQAGRVPQWQARAWTSASATASNRKGCSGTSWGRKVWTSNSRQGSYGGLPPVVRYSPGRWGRHSCLPRAG